MHAPAVELVVNERIKEQTSELERHSVERIPPPRPLMSQNCYHYTNARKHLPPMWSMAVYPSPKWPILCRVGR